MNKEKVGYQVSSNCRSSIITLHYVGQLFPDISEQLGIPANTCAKITRHIETQARAKEGITAKEEPSLSVCLEPDILNAKRRSGRKRLLTENDKVNILATV